MSWKKVKNGYTRDIVIPKEKSEDSTFMDFIYKLVGLILILTLVGKLTKLPSEKKNYKQFYE